MVASLDQLLQQSPSSPSKLPSPTSQQHLALQQGEILVQPHSGALNNSAAVLAHMVVPLRRAQVWSQVTNYSRWTQFFPNIVQSELLETVKTANGRYRRLYQVGSKGVMMLTARVEIYLRVYEQACDAIQFRFEKGTFSHFAADLNLQDVSGGTLVTYAVQAAPTIPVPSFLIEQAMKHDLPGNMEQMRRVLCGAGREVA